MIGHSFGTYIIVKSLLRLSKENAPKINTIILAGSVLKPDINLTELLGKKGCVKRVVNDCGLRDSVLFLTLFVWGTGMAGRLGIHGLQGEKLVNRFSKFGHSGYFKQDSGGKYFYIEKYWIPLLFDENTPQQIEQLNDSVSVFERIIRVLGENSPIATIVIYGLISFILISSYLTILSDRDVATNREKCVHAQWQMQEHSQDSLSYYEYPEGYIEQSKRIKKLIKEYCN